MTSNRSATRRFSRFSLAAPRLLQWTISESAVLSPGGGPNLPPRLSETSRRPYLAATSRNRRATIAVRGCSVLMPPVHEKLIRVALGCLPTRPQRGQTGNSTSIGAVIVGNHLGWSVRPARRRFLSKRSESSRRPPGGRFKIALLHATRVETRLYRKRTRASVETPTGRGTSSLLLRAQIGSRGPSPQSPARFPYGRKAAVGTQPQPMGLTVYG